MSRLTKGLVGVLVLMAALLAARTFAASTFVAGTIVHTLTGSHHPVDVQRGLSDGLRSLGTLAGELGAQAGRRSTISVLDAPGELHGRGRSSASGTRDSR